MRTFVVKIQQKIQQTFFKILNLLNQFRIRLFEIVLYENVFVAFIQNFKLLKKKNCQISSTRKNSTFLKICASMLKRNFINELSTNSILICLKTLNTKIIFLKSIE